MFIIDGRNMLTRQEAYAELKRALEAPDRCVITESLARRMFADRNPIGEELQLVGNRSVADYPDDATAVVWGRVDEQTDGSEQQPWIYQEFSGDNRYRLPRMQHLQAVVYNGWIVALGGNPLGASTSQAFSQLYVSRDAGLTWKSDSRLPMPDGFTASSSSFALAADDNGFLWIICGGSGQVWRGRLSQLGWQQ